MADQKKGLLGRADSLMDVHAAVRSRASSRAASRAASRLAESELGSQKLEDIQEAADYKIPEPIVAPKADWAAAVFCDANPGPGHVSAEKMMLQMIEESMEATSLLFRGAAGGESMELWKQVEKKTKTKSVEDGPSHFDQLREQAQQVQNEPRALRNSVFGQRRDFHESFFRVRHWPYPYAIINSFLVLRTNCFQLWSVFPPSFKRSTLWLPKGRSRGAGSWPLGALRCAPRVTACPFCFPSLSDCN
eukprot:251404-Rhodomonas_salina.2